MSIYALKKCVGCGEERRCQKLYTNKGDHMCWGWYCVESKADVMDAVWTLYGKYMTRTYMEDGNTPNWLALATAREVEADLYGLRYDHEPCADRVSGGAEMEDGWPQGEDGKFLPSRECETAA